MKPQLMVKSTRFQWLLDHNVLIDGDLFYCRWKTVASLPLETKAPQTGKPSSHTQSLSAKPCIPEP